MGMLDASLFSLAAGNIALPHPHCTDARPQRGSAGNSLTQWHRGQPTTWAGPCFGVGQTKGFFNLGLKFAPTGSRTQT
jgi:hypothetical protein